MIRRNIKESNFICCKCLASRSSGRLFSLFCSAIFEGAIVRIFTSWICDKTNRYPQGAPRGFTLTTLISCGFEGCNPLIPATCDPRSEPNRPPMTPAGNSPQTTVPSRVAGRCDPAGGRLRPPAFILHDFRPLGSPAHFGFRAIPVPAAHSPPHRALWCGSVCSCPCRNRRTQRPTGGHVPAWAAVVR